MTGEKFQNIDIPFEGSEESIEARLYGRGSNIVVISNMDTNDSEEWRPLVEALEALDCAVVTCAYPDNESTERALNSVIDFLESEGRAKGGERIVLIGASLGGVASLRVAANRGDDNIVGVAAISAPLEFGGERCYTDGELRMITAPKLIICSEFDDIVEDARNIFATLEDPRQFTLYPGDAHGTALLAEHGDSLALQLTEFTVWTFGR